METEGMSFKDSVAYGQQAIEHRILADIQFDYSLSDSRMASAYGTTTRALRSWMETPDVAAKMRDTTIARVGSISFELRTCSQKLWEGGVTMTDLYPLWKLAGELGRSPSSAAFRTMCQEGRMTCYDTPIFGIYVPKAQAEALKAKGA